MFFLLSVVQIEIPCSFQLMCYCGMSCQEEENKFFTYLFFWIGSRSHWSPLSVWSWIWWYWNCDSSTIYHPFDGWNSGLVFILCLVAALIMFKMSDICKCFYSCRGSAIEMIMLLNIGFDLSSYINLYFFLSFFPGFICSGTVGVAWYALAHPLHIVMARQNLLLWSDLASPWSLQVRSLSPIMLWF